MHVARVLFPAIRWDARTGFRHEEAAVDAALRAGVGGFSIFGGTADAVAELTGDLRARSAHALLIASDLERGAGQQFAGATSLPPLAALGSLGDLEATRRAARLTTREALALGVNWIYAPVADVDLEPRNPIVGSRAFGSDPDAVARQVAAWVRGCADEGAICCAKHFPGHGRTVDDSHARLPVVAADRFDLEQDLKPFRAAIMAGVDSIMTAHVAYPAFDASGTAATLSTPIVAHLLRRELGFAGLIVTDALIMEGVLQAGHGEAQAAVAAIAAGCDALLYPKDLAGCAAALEKAVGRGLDEVRIADAIERVSAISARTPAGGGGRAGVDWGSAQDGAWAAEIGARSIRVVRGTVQCPREVHVLTIDDDLGGPFAPPPRDAFLRKLREHGIDARETDEADEDQELILAVYSDIRAWKGRPGLSEGALQTAAGAVAAQPNALVVLFGHPRLAAELPGQDVLAAWGGEPVMQEAAARLLAFSS